MDQPDTSPPAAATTDTTASAAAEHAALVADAARYRWLAAGQRIRQGKAVDKVGGRTIMRDELRVLMEFNFWCRRDQLDAAIDKAMAALQADSPSAAG